MRPSTDNGIGHAVCSAAGKPDEMLFINILELSATIHHLDTWTQDLTDERATWRLVPADCAAVNCTLPDFEALWADFEEQANSGRLWGIVMLSLFSLCCAAGCWHGHRKKDCPWNEKQREGTGEGAGEANARDAAPPVVVQAVQVEVAALP